jgi:hypothetical protein
VDLGSLGKAKQEVVVEPDWVIQAGYSRDRLIFGSSHPHASFNGGTRQFFGHVHGFFYRVRILQRQLTLRSRFREPEKKDARGVSERSHSSIVYPMGIPMHRLSLWGSSFTALTILTVRVMQ